MTERADAARRSAHALPARFRRPLEGPHGARASAPRQIYPGRSRQRRDPGDPSGHVGPHERLCRRQAAQRWATMSTTPRPTAPAQGKHDHVVFETDAPARIVFNDHRRFGLMTLVTTDEPGDGQTVQGHRRRTLVGRIQRRLSGKGAGRARKRPSNRRCWISAWWRAWAISMSARRCSAPASRPSGWRARSSTNESPGTGDGAIKTGAEGRHRGRRLNLARPCPGHRRSRQFPASFSGLWPRGQALPGARIAAEPSSALSRLADPPSIARPARNRAPGASVAAAREKRYRPASFSQRRNAHAQYRLRPGSASAPRPSAPRSIPRARPASAALSARWKKPSPRATKGRAWPP